MVVLVMGLPGSGKSFFAGRLAKALHADYISSDRLRKKLFSERTYSPPEKEKVYDEMLAQMRRSLLHEDHVVLDATFYKNRYREKFRKEVLKSGDLAMIEVSAAESLIEERLLQHREESDADVNIYKMIRDAWEPIPEKHLTLHSTNDNIEIMLQEAMHYLQVMNYGKGTGK